MKSILFCMPASIGLLGGLCCLVFLVGCPLALARVSGKEPPCALLLFLWFVIGGTIRRRRSNRQPGGMRL